MNVRWIAQDHLTLPYERVAKITKVATTNPAIKRIVRCSALALVNRRAQASSTPGKIWAGAQTSADKIFAV